MSKRFDESKLPHESDDCLLQRCQDEVSEYERYFSYVEPRNHTTSYLAAAYLALYDKYLELEKKVESK